MNKKQHDYDKILVRLIETLRILSTNKEVSLKNLSDEFNVSLRTIQRDMKRLEKFGVVKTKDGYRLNKALF